MASAALSPAQLLTLGMFLFGMDTLAYDALTRRTEWRHPSSERHMARPAFQFTGPGDDKVTITGLLVPEIAGSYGAIERLREMADTGDAWPLVDGLGRQLGVFHITRLEEEHFTVMAGGTPRQVGFNLELERVD